MVRRQQPGDFVATVGCVRRYSLRVQPLVVAVCWKYDMNTRGYPVGLIASTCEYRASTTIARA
jgi:hypothetical protein